MACQGTCMQSCAVVHPGAANVPLVGSTHRVLDARSPDTTTPGDSGKRRTRCPWKPCSRAVKAWRGGGVGVFWVGGGGGMDGSRDVEPNGAPPRRRRGGRDK